MQKECGRTEEKLDHQDNMAVYHEALFLSFTVTTSDIYGYK